MAYTFNDVNLETEYNIGIERIEGNIGLPTRKRPTEYSFEDAFGSAPFTTADDIKWEARTIRLHCHLSAPSREEFFNRLNKLRNDLLAEGENELVLKHDVNTYKAFFHAGSEFRLRSRWNSIKNVGQFVIPFVIADPIYPALWRGLIGHWTLGADEEVLGSELVTGGQDMTDAEWLSMQTPETNEQTDHDGQTNCRHIVDDPASYGGCYSSTKWTTVTGATYKVTFKFKFISGSRAAVQIRKGDNSGSHHIDNWLTDSSWTTKTYYFKETAGGAQAYIFFINYGTSSAEFYVDEVSIKEVKTDDLSDENNDGELYGFGTSPTSNIYTTDREGNSNECLDFDGVDDYIDNGDQDIYDIDNLTVSAWIYRDADSGTYEAIVSKTNGSNGHRSWGFMIRTNDKICISVSPDGSTPTYFVESSTSIQTGQWYHVLGVYDGIYLKIYVNGVLENTEEYSSGIFDSDSHLEIGRIWNSTYNFNGKIHDVRVYNRALSNAEIKLLYHQYDDQMDM